MYGPLNLYNDIYWGTDGYVYAYSQVTPSVTHYSHQYKATAKITAPNGSSVTNTSSWSYNSAQTLATYDFDGVYLDGLFINDGKGEGWCGIVHNIFSTVLAQQQTNIPAWVRLGDFGNFVDECTGTGGFPGSTKISISYTFSNNAAGKTFNLSFGMGLTGTLVAGDITVAGSGTKAVTGTPVEGTYEQITTTNHGTVRAAVNATAGSATIIGDPYRQSTDTFCVNGG
jgi:hypothetical protein